MSSEKNESNIQLNPKLDSPFLDELIFSEKDTGIIENQEFDSALYQLESPFLQAFETIDEEIFETDAELEGEFVDEESFDDELEYLDEELKIEGFEVEEQEIDEAEFFEDEEFAEELEVKETSSELQLYEESNEEDELEAGEYKDLNANSDELEMSEIDIIAEMEMKKFETQNYDIEEDEFFLEEAAEMEDEFCEGEIEEEFLSEDELEANNLEFQIIEGKNSFGEVGGERIQIKKDPLKIDLTSIKGRYGKAIPLHKKTKEAWGKMVAAARAAGFPHPLLLPTSGYRSTARQRILFKRAVKKYGSRQAAGKWVAAPGGSAHHSGRALDLYIGSKNSSVNVTKLRKTKIYKWLNENAFKFGFYPYKNEPWHWEYNPTAVQEGTSVSNVVPVINSWLQSLVQKGVIGARVFMALIGGERNPGELTDLIFYSRHPDRKGKPLRRSETRLVSEWKDIKNSIILPILKKMATSGKGASAPTNISSPQIGGQKFGKLVVDTSHPALRKSHPSYQFTKDDALWLARFVEGEAGGRDNANNHAVIWTMFNRYGIFRHRVSAWTSFGVFIQKYSTTLQPMLKSVGAAKRVWRNHQQNPEKYPIVVGVGTYKGTNIKKVQYKKHDLLQQKPWEKFSSTVRNLVTRILTGQIPNPGIGIATEFASTRIYYKQRHGVFPTEKQWRAYTQKHRNQKWTWIGNVPGINQMKNAFFVVNRLKNVPPEAVKAEP